MTDLELVRSEDLVNPVTGEVLPATPDNAALIRRTASDQIAAWRDIQYQCDQILAEESRRLGTKTLHLAHHDVVMSGGLTRVYDPVELQENLRTVDCPEERINQLVTETISYKINRNVLRQLQSANEDYRTAIELASHEEEKPWRATVK